MSVVGDLSICPGCRRLRVWLPPGEWLHLDLAATCAPESESGPGPDPGGWSHALAGEVFDRSPILSDEMRQVPGGCRSVAAWSLLLPPAEPQWFVGRRMGRDAGGVYG
jgi:hypothetical protein